MKYFGLIPFLLLACSDGDKDSTDDGDVVVDSDGDGFAAADDCDDNNADINPEAAETCDGMDNNCDGVIDEGVLTTYYADADGDGYGHPDITTESCSAIAGFVEDNTDCDDSSADAYPGGEETCDGLDNDCNGEVDETGAVGEVTYYTDADTKYTNSCKHKKLG